MEVTNLAQCFCCRQIKELFCFYRNTAHPVCAICYISGAAMYDHPPLAEEDLGPVNWPEEGF